MQAKLGRVINPPMGQASIAFSGMSCPGHTKMGWGWYCLLWSVQAQGVGLVLPSMVIKSPCLTPACPCPVTIAGGC